jgi:hypothetical protein
MKSINFNTFDHNFCESTIYSSGQHPEYANAISSLFISWIGYKGLKNQHNNFSTIMLYSSLFINGITSCFYHYYNNIGCGLLDRMSMILIAMSSTYLFIQHIQHFLIFEKWKYYETITKFIHIIIIIYFTLLFTIAGLHWETTFNILFGLFLSSLVIYIYLIDKHQSNLKIPKYVINYGWKGVKYIIVSGLIWIITEIFCNYLNIFKYIFGHVWWHVFVSLGGYFISLVPVYLMLRQINCPEKVIVIKLDKGFLPYVDYD